jgi:hypothetical protein
VRDLSKASLNLKRALWGDKPEGLHPENCPNFSFFFCWGRITLNFPEKVQFFREIYPTKSVILIMGRKN